MIEIINDKLFHLTTVNTSYVFTALNSGELLHLHYGRKINLSGNGRNALLQKWFNQNGCSVETGEGVEKFCPDDEKFEFPTQGTGDMRTPAIVLKFADGGESADFLFEKSEEVEFGEAYKELTENFLPHSYWESEEVALANKALCVTMKERTENVRVKLYYFVYPECDVITRSAVIVNDSEKRVQIKSVASLCLDMDADVMKVSTFHGDWGREMGKSDVLLTGGKFVNESRSGNSSNHSNPFAMYAEPGATEEAGEVYATNLVYSGNHRESVEFGGHGKARILTGINPALFGMTLEAGEHFVTPEAVITHTTEACYFGINEGKLLKLAEKAKDCGMELFVTDDGWFGHRNGDNSSLGDWYDCREKLPKGIAHLSKKVKELGLMFGIWVEPEMVNEESDLYRAHPDWVIRNPQRKHNLGRNQMILDFSKKEVQENIIEQMTEVFTRSQCDYVKWDMNRNFSDYFRTDVEPERISETAHAYILGVYRVMKILTDRFPNVLFEGCASGGNRFDLGILTMFPQIWASDDTDAVARAGIQNSYSYGYPQSTWSAHVSAVPNHQTLRDTPMATRFAVASMGVFGYELNLCDLSGEELDRIKEQVEFYKKWRHTLQYGDFYRLGGKVQEQSFEKYTGGFISAKLDSTLTRNIIVSKDKTNAVAFMVNGLVNPNYSHTYLRLTGLDADKTYLFSNRERKFDIHVMGSLVNTMAPIHIKQDGVLHNLLARFVKLDGDTESYAVKGELLNNAGIQLSQCFAGSGYGAGTRIYSDFESRIYEIVEIKDNV